MVKNISEEITTDEIYVPDSEGQQEEPPTNVENALRDHFDEVQANVQKPEDTMGVIDSPVATDVKYYCEKCSGNAVITRNDGVVVCRTCESDNLVII